MTKKYIHKDGRTAKVVGYDKDGKTVRGCNGYVYYKEDLLKNGFTLEAPTEECPVCGDNFECMTCGKKPVEQELIPLLPRDIVAITDEIITLDELGKVDEDRIHKVLSKYGVHKQEEVKGCNNTTFEENFGKLYGTYRKFQTAKVQERLVKSGYIMHDVENNNEALRDFLKYYHMIQD